MKTAFFSQKATAFALLGISATLAGCSSAPKVESQANAQIQAQTNPLPSIPKPSGTSATEKEILKWYAKAEQDPKSDKAWVNLGDALMQKMRETQNFTLCNHAETAYNQALAINAKDSDAMTGLAWVFGERHTFDKSVEWANKALALDPKNNIAYGIISDAETELGEYKAAMDHCQKMIDLRPDLSSYSRGAYLLYISGDLRFARRLMDMAIRAGGPFAENTAWCRSRLAMMEFADGNLLAAEKLLEQSLKSNPKNVHLLSMMGKVKAGMKKYSEAIDYYKRANAVAPEHNTTAALADLYRLTGNPTEADKQEQALETLHTANQGKGVHDHMQMAQFYSDHDKNSVEAVRLAEEHKNSKNVFEADILAWCYYKNGQYPEAKEAITRALAQNTPEAKFYYHAGMIEAKLGNSNGAQELLAKALSLNPQFSPTESPKAIAAVQQLGELKVTASADTANTKATTR